MILLRAAGLIDRAPLEPEQDALEDEAMEVLLDTAIRFHMSGLTSLREYLSLSETEIGALILAKRKVQAEFASQIGYASQGLEQAARVSAPADGGRSIDKLSLARAVAEAAVKCRNRVVPPVRAG